MNSAIKNYRDLLVWQKSIALTKQTYAFCNLLPDYEKYGLCSQMRRSAVSVAANIAEGHARRSTKRYLYHLDIAHASLCELETHAVIACELGFCNTKTRDNLLKDSAEIGRMLNGLIQSLQKRLNTPDSRTLNPVPLRENHATNDAQMQNPSGNGHRVRPEL